MNFSFIHAADLHLGSPFLGLASQDSELAALVASASREALDDLVTRAIDLRVGFFVIAGDIYDGDWKDTSIGLFFHRQMSRLERANIPVFLVRGNHDAESVITRAVRPPQSVRTFDHKRPETLRIPDLKVALHGQSFADRAVNANLAAAYPAVDPGWFNIGVLHTSCDNRPGHDNYAPCSLNDLIQRGYQYWALGHVHGFEVLNQNPHILYAGNLQGRNIRECGDKGAVLVEVEDNEVISASHLCFSRVRWASLSIDLADVKSEEDAFELYRKAIAEEVEQAKGSALIFRISLEGVTSLHSQLHQDLSRLGDEVKAAAGQCGDNVWLEEVKLHTKEPVDPNAEQLAATGINLTAMLSQILHSPDLLEQARIDLQAIVAKMPSPAMAGALSDEETLGELLDDAFALVAGSELQGR